MQWNVYTTPPQVFDTLGGRSFRPAPPAPDCIAPLFGGGRLGWACPGSGVPLIQNLGTNVVREAVGWKAVEALETDYSSCGATAIGRYWLSVGCGQGSCCRCLWRCWSIQLGSRYVTWANGGYVLAYFPRTHRRVMLEGPRAAFDWEQLAAVAHACNRVFAQWGTKVFVARVKPRWGAPRCPSLPPSAS